MKLRLATFGIASIAAGILFTLSACGKSISDVAGDLGVTLDSTVTLERQGVSLVLPKPILVVDEQSVGLPSGDSTWTTVLTARQIQISVAATENDTHLDSAYTMSAQYTSARLGAKALFSVEDSIEVTGKPWRGIIYRGQGAAGQAETADMAGYVFVAAKDFRTYTVQAYSYKSGFSEDSTTILGIVQSIELQ